MMKELDELISKCKQMEDDSNKFLNLDEYIYKLNKIQEPIDFKEATLDVYLSTPSKSKIIPSKTSSKFLVELLDHNDSEYIHLIFELDKNPTNLWRFDYRLLVSSFNADGNELMCLSKPILINSSLIDSKAQLKISKCIFDNNLLKANQKEIYSPNIKTSIDEDNGIYTIYLCTSEEDKENVQNDNKNQKINKDSKNNSIVNNKDQEGKSKACTIPDKSAHTIFKVDSKFNQLKNSKSKQISLVDSEKSALDFIQLKVRLEEIDYGFAEYERNILVNSLKSSIQAEFNSE